jgi:hypothetical protein
MIACGCGLKKWSRLWRDITGLGAAVVDRMVLVEQWGRPADTYEVVLTGEKLESFAR